MPPKKCLYEKCDNLVETNSGRGRKKLYCCDSHKVQHSQNVKKETTTTTMTDVNAHVEQVRATKIQKCGNIATNAHQTKQTKETRPDGTFTESKETNVVVTHESTMS